MHSLRWLNSQSIASGNLIHKSCSMLTIACQLSFSCTFLSQTFSLLWWHFFSVGNLLWLNISGRYCLFHSSTAGEGSGHWGQLSWAASNGYIFCALISLYLFVFISANGLLALRLHICLHLVYLFGDSARRGGRGRKGGVEGCSIGSKIYGYGRHWAGQTHLAGAS